MSTTPKKNVNESNKISQALSEAVTTANEICFKTPIKPIKTPKRTNSDRFIPNRAGIDFDHCNYLLNLTENSLNGSASRVPGSAKTPIQSLYQEEILANSNSIGGKRLIDCFDRKPEHMAKRSRSILKVIGLNLSSLAFELTVLTL